MVRTQWKVSFQFCLYLTISPLLLSERGSLLLSLHYRHIRGKSHPKVRSDSIEKLQCFVTLQQRMSSKIHPGNTQSVTLLRSKRIEASVTSTSSLRVSAGAAGEESHCKANRQFASAYERKER